MAVGSGDCGGASGIGGGSGGGSGGGGRSCSGSGSGSPSRMVVEVIRLPAARFVVVAGRASVHTSPEVECFFFAALGTCIVSVLVSFVQIIKSFLLIMVAFRSYCRL